MSTQYYCAATLDGYIADADDGLDWLIGYEGSFEAASAEAGPMSEGGSYERFFEGVGALVSGSVTYEFILGQFAEGGKWPYVDKPYWGLRSSDLATLGGQGVVVRIENAKLPDLYHEMLASAGE